MADTFELEIATPERLVVRERVTEAHVPAHNGYIGVLPGHAPLLSELGTGMLSYTSQGRRLHMAVSDGWVEVQQHRVRILTAVGEKADEIDVRLAEEALRQARERLATATEGPDIADALTMLRRAQARLEASRYR